ncbi:MAG: undecaprenyldiphospho-muramoylpentapeptide beta-N-acetylglucosaminyltransferase [Clostridia bacterium]|nr:undecaprenyldiphospho-muramoylpentapeptide beta-N-acetylglucosaminyltransferase [Clostridia bacterium]MBQ5820562.1 undecaprenyldiphospho-muramoylpentapeptide beta-N-acetylglucosaminyltransferase [Clostridia bacterium]
MKFLVACGGTSGHINPALAIAGELRRRHPDAEFLFVGTATHLEADLIPRAGYRLETIEVTGLRRRKNFAAIKHNVTALSKFVKARARVRRILKEYRPDVVIGTGGYVSAPVLSQAAGMGFKTVIHEQNAFAGMTTKMLAPKVDRVLLSFPLAHPIKCDPEKCTVIGNPVKSEFLSMTKEEARKELGIAPDEAYVLSYGGSLGATKINDAFLEMARLAAPENAVTFCHGAARDYARMTEALKDLSSDRIHVYEYIYDMPLRMAAADVVIARSGAMTLTELAVLGKASILIPSPNVTENHQYFNAKTYSDAGAAVLLEEKDLTGETLYETLCDLVFDKGRLCDMERACRTLAHPAATARICDAIEALIP